MKVVIDTNVLISAALKDKDPEALLLYVVEQPAFAWVVSPEILSEYKTTILSVSLFKKLIMLSE